MRAFDAAETFYRESDRGDVSTWSTVSLVYALKDLVLRPPEIRSRDVHAGDVMRQLAAVTLNVDHLVRFGLRLDITSSIAYHVIGLTLDAGARAKEGSLLSLLSTTRVQGWVALRDQLCANSQFEEVHADLEAFEATPPLPDVTTKYLIGFTILGPFMRFLDAWMASSPLEDILSWTVPKLTDVAYAFERPTPTADEQNAVWLVDRFTEAYLEDWSPHSLKLEYGYMRGNGSVPCHNSVMAERRVEINELALKVADMEVSPSRDQRRINNLIHQAIKLVREGRRSAAAAMFAAFCDGEFNADGQMDNNHGFCLLPDDPEGALFALERARKAGFSETINIANRILALFWQGKNVAAFNLAESALEAWAELDRGDKAVVWSYIDDPTTPVLQEGTCVRCYLAGLAAHIASELGDTSSAARYVRLIEAAGSGAD